MIHTLTIQTQLTKEEVFFLQDKYGTKDLTTICNLIDSKHNGFTSFIKLYNYNITRLFITIDLIKILNTSNIEEKHYSWVEVIVNNYLAHFNLILDYFILNRIDYRLDIKINDKLKRQQLFIFYNNTLKKYKFFKKHKLFNSSVLYENNSMQIIIYDKEQERRECGQIIKGYEKDTIRMEVRLLNKHLTKNKSRYNIPKTIKDYFKQDLYIKYLSKYLYPIFYKGDYYKLGKAKQIIEKSTLKDKDKIFLIKFLNTNTKYGITESKERFSYYKFTKALNQLELLNINPILIESNRNLPNLIENPIKNIPIK